MFGTYLTTLGVLRCLHAAGHKAYCATPQLPFVRASRHYRPASGGQELLRDTETGLLENWLVKSDISGAVLFPCSDDWVTAISNLPEDLRARFRSSIPPKSALNQLIDKANLERLGKELQLPRPLSWFIDSDDDLPAESDVPYEECFLKPLLSQKFHHRFGVKAFFVKSRTDAIAKLNECREAGISMILQRYVLGPASNHYFVDGFVDRAGTICAMVARQRLRMYPLDFGDSSYMTSVNLNEVGPAPEHLTRLLKHVNYRGIFSAEFKRDERDGELKLIEVNTRAWAYIQFAMMCGANVAEMAVADALNMPVKKLSESDVGRSMKIFPKDFAAARSVVRAGEIGRMRVIREWLSARSSLFSWGDPSPWIVQRYDDFSNALRRRLRSRFGAKPSQ